MASTLEDAQIFRKFASVAKSRKLGKQIGLISLYRVRHNSAVDCNSHRAFLLVQIESYASGQPCDFTPVSCDNTFAPFLDIP